MVKQERVSLLSPLSMPRQREIGREDNTAPCKRTCWRLVLIQNGLGRQAGGQKRISGTPPFAFARSLLPVRPECGFFPG